MSQQDKTTQSEEITAVATIVDALKSLHGDDRQRVLRAALTLLGEEIAPTFRAATEGATPVATADKPAAGPGTVPLALPAKDIKTLKTEKEPKSDIEMVALIAYYLAEVAPEELRRDYITAEDIKKYFTQAGEKLPKVARYTLVNAKRAGYLDSAGHARYKLTPVGHNLVVHNLPRPVARAGRPQSRKRRRKPRSEKS